MCVNEVQGCVWIFVPFPKKLCGLGMIQAHPSSTINLVPPSAITLIARHDDVVNRDPFA
jgi:hypothetical protein